MMNAIPNIQKITGSIKSDVGGCKAATLTVNYLIDINDDEIQYIQFSDFEFTPNYEVGKGFKVQEWGDYINELPTSPMAQFKFSPDPNIVITVDLFNIEPIASNKDLVKFIEDFVQEIGKKLSRNLYNDIRKINKSYDWSQEISL